MLSRDNCIMNSKFEDMDCRERSIFALGITCSDNAAKALMTAIKKGDIDLSEFIYPMSDISTEYNIQQLAGLLKDKRVEMRIFAAEVLGWMQNKKAVDVLLEALNDKDPDVRRIVAQALGKIGDGRAIDALLDKYKNDTASVSGSAKYSILTLKGDYAAKVMIKNLKSKDPELRALSAQSLGYYGSLSAVEPLINALSDNNIDVKKYSVESLGYLRDARASEPLMKFLKTKNQEFLVSVISALGWIGEQKAAEQIIAIAESSTDKKVISSALEVLGKLKCEKALPALCLMLVNKDEDIADIAMNAILNIDSPISFKMVEAILGCGVATGRYRASIILFQLFEQQSELLFEQAIGRNDSAIVAGAYKYYIKNGKENAQIQLISGLAIYGDEDMATDFMNCGNVTLENAGKAWAESKGYYILAGAGSRALGWGIMNSLN